MEDPKREDRFGKDLEITRLRLEQSWLRRLVMLLLNKGAKPSSGEIEGGGTALPEQKGAFRPAVTLLEYEPSRENPGRKVYNPKVLVDGPFGAAERMNIRWHYRELHSAVYSGADVVMSAALGTYSVFVPRPGEIATRATRPPQGAAKGPRGELIYEADGLSVRFDANLTCVSAEKLVILGDNLTFYGKKIIISFRAQISSWSDRN